MGQQPVDGLTIGPALIAALGLPHESTHITIEVSVEQPVTVTVRFFPRAAQMQAVVEHLATYQLVRLDSPTQDEG